MVSNFSYAQTRTRVLFLHRDDDDDDDFLCFIQKQTKNAMKNEREKTGRFVFKSKKRFLLFFVEILA